MNGQTRKWMNESQPRLSQPTWIDGAPYDPTQGVPGPVVEPVVEVVEALLGQEPRRAVVEVRIELVDHALVPQHREQPHAERCGKKDDDCEQWKQ